MAEGKYGHLLTERDAALIVSGALQICGVMDVPQSYAAQLVRDFVALGQATFPPDEPLFLLRGQDAATPDTIAAYATRVVELGGAGAHTRAVGAAYIAVRDWQINHPDRVKVPD